MKTIHRIGIGVLVGIFFAAGYAFRMQVSARDQALAAIRENAASVSTPGTRIASMNLEGAANVDFRPLQTLLSVVTNLRQHYVEQITSEDEGRMTYEALKSMLASFKDPNTRFIGPIDRKVLADAQDGKFHGIGAVLGIKQVKTGVFVDSTPSDEREAPPLPPARRTKREVVEEHLIVISTLPNSPAAKAGLRSGDDIIAIDGGAVLPFDPYQRVDKIIKDARNNKGDRAQLKKELEAEQKRIENGIGIIDAQNMLTRDDEKSLELTIVPKGSDQQKVVKLRSRELVLEPVVNARIDDKYGYIKINCFCNSTGDKFADAIRAFDAPSIQGLVLDLRGTSGGSIESARQVAKWFAPGKTLALEMKSHKRKSSISIPSNDAKAWTRPTVVLVDNSTAQTPEVLAAALRENAAARLVGQKTYGDFCVTTLMDQVDGSAIMMTTGAFLTGKGGDYAGKGVPVDVAVSPGPSGDNQLDQAVKLLDSADRGS